MPGPHTFYQQQQNEKCRFSYPRKLKRRSTQADASLDDEGSEGDVLSQHDDAQSNNTNCVQHMSRDPHTSCSPIPSYNYQFQVKDTFHEEERVREYKEKLKKYEDEKAREYIALAQKYAAKDLQYAAKDLQYAAQADREKQREYDEKDKVYAARDLAYLAKDRAYLAKDKAYVVKDKIFEDASAAKELFYTEKDKEYVEKDREYAEKDREYAYAQPQSDNSIHDSVYRPPYDEFAQPQPDYSIHDSIHNSVHKSECFTKDEDDCSTISSASGCANSTPNQGKIILRIPTRSGRAPPFMRLQMNKKI